MTLKINIALGPFEPFELPRMGTVPTMCLRGRRWYLVAPFGDTEGIAAALGYVDWQEALNRHVSASDWLRDEFPIDLQQRFTALGMSWSSEMVMCTGAGLIDLSAASIVPEAQAFIWFLIDGEMNDLQQSRTASLSGQLH